MEPRLLSSRMTFFNKFVVPILYIVGFAGGTLAISLNRRNMPPGAPGFSPFLFIIFLGLGGVAIYWTTTRLKYVRMDDRFLYISNGLREIEVPLRDVTEVRYSRWTRTHLVTVEFAHETEFGESIVFMPSIRMFALWSVHPVVAEIEAAVAMATGRTLSPD
ncbi:MAG TPA: hypothetical protein VMJ30_09475 [Gemmatimonadales bacterium]|nr:hypothetical protein [Gemmatimonadales bacterium]